MSKQPCHRPAMHIGAAIMSGPRTTNAALAMPRITRLRSTILRARRGGADRDALWFMPPSETEGRCGGYAIFDTSAIHVIRRIKELAQPDSEMVPSLVIAPAQLLQVLDDSSVNIALPIQDELAVTPAHLPWAVNA
ncbi:hypothetical protein [Streptomyces sp. NBC_01751]|uniref:hypothetical protein n=1 Tax=Streptomyces sp. NBC_01751 TaxID=2975929 RepID=UPI002DDB0518|nr:hypothetical protein [Streptomyces sp. NBC_01751]WSD30495.1 hypothetical protein OHA26_36785 [Streptomyces sp. NBC_01751]